LKIAIVGAGISGLATAHALRSRQPELEIELFEAGERTGGKVWTEHTPEGYTCEWGVNGFLDNKPKTLDLARALELTPLRGSAEAARRYVFRHGQLHALPESPPAFLTSKLMSLPGRLRVMCEPFMPRGKADDETLADFARRRLGPEARDALIDPMASGVFAGDPARMSLKSCFPRIHEIESEFGSLIRGMIRLQVRARKEGKGKGPGPGPGGKLTSFEDGMSEMTDRLTMEFSDVIRLKTAVRSLDRSGDRFLLHLGTGETAEADRVILASPAYAQAEMLTELAPDISGQLRQIPYPSVGVVCLGYETDRLQNPLDGFGFLVPSTEQRGILGTVVDSNVFPTRAPEGHMLFRTLVGGSRAADKAQLPEAKLLDLVRSELRDILGMDTDPAFAKIYIHQQAIPQYHVGHAQRLEDIDAARIRHPGLYLTGNAYRGVSLNDCIENAWRTAGEVLEP
jgi:oxygen-dependent protoporphyrinogen oxidase